jgi:hypothetical protein
MSKMAKTATMVSLACAALVGGAGAAAADSGAEGVAAYSPGLLSGNVLQHPTHLPLNLCGNTYNDGGALNAAFGNACVND